MRVLGWLGDFSACGHYRIGWPFEINGWQFTDKAIHDADVIVAQRVQDPGPTREFRKACADPARMAILDLDDDLFAVDRSHPGHQHFNDPGQQQRLVENLGAAQMVTVSTEPLAAVARQHADNVMVLPNYIPELLLHVERPVNDRIVIGWAGSNSHSRDFGELAKPLRRVLQRYGDRVEFHCVGTDYTARVSSNRGRTRFTPWVEDVWDYYEHLDFDICVAPLHGSVFNESKSDLRLREAAALGIPTIASNTGPYATAMLNGCPAIPASSHKDWERELVDLIENTERRHERSQLGRAWATPLTIEANAYRWRDTYEQTRQGAMA